MTINAAGATLVERLEGAWEAVDVFRRWARLPHAVFFDSADHHRPPGGEPLLGRYSFVAADPIEWWEASGDGTAPLAAIDRVVSQMTEDWRADLPPFQGGVAGVFGYELAGTFERLPRARIADFAVPTLAAGWYDVVAAFDHQEGTAWLISQGWDATATRPETDVEARRERAAERLDEFRRWLRAEPPAHDQITHEQSPPLALADLAPQYDRCHGVQASRLDGLTSNFSREGYLATVRRGIEYIHAGDAFQVNLSQRLLHPARDSAVELYCRLRERNPAPFAGYLDAGEWQFCSASPERFLRVSEGHVETRPIKGTAARSGQLSADQHSGERLSASKKDRAENVMIVDLLRNDLSRCCRPESVRVAKLCGLESYGWVQHLVSVVEGQLRDDQRPLDLLCRAFPGGSVTGAPKVRAMEIIAELEPTVRGAYCGSLAYLGAGGQMDSNILIRTVTAGRGWWQFPVGGGIVARSEAQQEYEETWIKAKGMLRALRP